MSDHTIETLSGEDRRFPPSAAFAAQANAQADVYDEPFEAFWERNGRERVTWFEPFTELYHWELPYAQWYLGGKLNVAYNCVDRHVEAGRGDRVAYHWEGEPAGETRTITYAELQRDVVRMANALKEIGVGKGTAVAIYMGMVPELAVAMLACTRLGAPHTVVFGGFSADSLSDRINNMGCEVLVTQDEAWRRGKPVPLKAVADEALAAAPGVRATLVVRRTGNPVPMTEGRDRWYHELDVSDDPASCPCEPMDSEDLLFLMYTSGTTANPKGIAHTTAGYLVGVATTHSLIFDLKPETDVYWCAADIGWITGHSYIVYGPLCNGATSVMYEGTPDYPESRALVGDHRALRRDHALHRADGDQGAHEVGLRARRGTRSLVAAAARLGGRAHQPRGVDVVPPAHRRRALPDRRHVVADRDGDGADHAAAGRDDDEARLGDAPVPGCRGGDPERGGGARRAGRWLPRAREALAGNDPRDLRRRRPVPRDVLVAVPRPLLRR